MWLDIVEALIGNAETFGAPALLPDSAFRMGLLG